MQKVQYKNIVPPGLHQRKIPLCDQMKIFVQTMQYQAPPKALEHKCRNNKTSVEEWSEYCSPCTASVVSPRPYKCKCKSRRKQCYIRLIQKHNLVTHMQKQQNLSKRVFRQIIVPPDWIEGTSPMLPNENLNVNSAILDLYKNTT